MQIESSPAVLEEIRLVAVAGFCRFPRGGVEVGGLLFGGHGGGVVRVLAARPVECEYLFGPSFVLSPRDGERLAAALAAARTDPDLKDLEVVGWYHSHTRSEVYLSEPDLETFRKHFPQPWQVALVVRPEPFGSARAGFFVREPDGSVRAEASYSEFAISPGVRARRPPPPEAPASDGPAVVPRPPERALVPDLPQPAAVPQAPALRRRPFPLTLAVLAATVVVLAVLGWASVRLFHPPPAPDEPLSLRVLDVNGQLQIFWDRKAGPIRQARSASLEITDGTQPLKLPFDRVRLELGRTTYNRKSDNVEVRLRVETARDGEHEEFVRFVGPPLPAVFEPAPTEPPVAQVPDLPHPEPPAGTAVKREPVRSVPAKAFNLAGLPSPRPAANPVLPAPPPVSSQPRGVRAESALAPPLRLETPPTPAPPAPAVAAPARSAPAYLGPRSGRIIWTGQLSSGGALAIDGQHASAGAVNAALPGVPIEVSAHPAELTSHGLVVYTAAARALREPAGPQNGWNETTYTREPRRASSLLVLDLPSAPNGWKRLSVRNDGAPVSLIVIDWRVAQ